MKEGEEKVKEMMKVKEEGEKKKKGNWTDNTIDRFVTTYSIIREQYYLI